MLEMYENEKETGEGELHVNRVENTFKTRTAIKSSGIARDKLFITSKLSYPESVKDVRSLLKKQLADLQVEYVDLVSRHL